MGSCTASVAAKKASENLHVVFLGVFPFFTAFCGVVGGLESVKSLVYKKCLGVPSGRFRSFKMQRERGSFVPLPLYTTSHVNKSNCSFVLSL